MLTWIEVNKKHILYNLRSIKSHLQKGVSLMPVIKSNAYGHGLGEVAKLCDTTSAVTAVCVVGIDEALQIKRAGFKKPVIVLAVYDTRDTPALEEAIKRGVHFPLFTEQQAKVLHTIARRLKRTVMVHLKLDTGTSRIGILAKEAALFGQKMCSRYKNIECVGIFSHFASSESDKQFTLQQLSAFTHALSELEKRGVPMPKIRHMACSAATLKHPTTQLTAVRVGINTYGLHSIEKGDKFISLKPALSWYTTVIQVKKIAANTGVSYGRTFITKRPTILAVLPVGYYDGYPRALSNKSHVIVRGKRCPVRGRICMNLMMVDVTGVPSVKAGDRVTLIGSDHNSTVSADELAGQSSTINYELVSRINPLITRLYM